MKKFLTVTIVALCALSLGSAARNTVKIKVRQPLAEAVVVAAGRESEAIEALADTVREELNVRSMRFVAAAEELGSYEVKANYRTLGPLFGKDMPLAAEAIAALDPARIAAALREGSDGAAGQVGITVAGREQINDRLRDRGGKKSSRSMARNWRRAATEIVASFRKPIERSPR